MLALKRNMYRKNASKKLICLIVVFMLCAVLTTVPAFAANTGHYTGMGGDTVDVMVTDLYGGNAFNGIEDAITLSGGAVGTAFTQALNYGKTIYNNVLRNVGIFLMVLYWMLWLAQAASNGGQVSIELMTKGFVKLIAAVWLIFNAMNLLCGSDGSGGLFAFGEALVNAIGGSTAATGASIDYDAIGTQLGTGSLIKNFMAIIMLFIPWVLAKLCGVIAWMIAYFRAFEIVLRIMWAPIAMGDIFSGGENPGALRWVRGFIACMLQGALILVILRLYTIFASASTSGGTNVWMASIFAFVAVGMMFKSQGFAREICGC